MTRLRYDLPPLALGIGFVLTYSIPLVVILSVIAGRTTPCPNLIAFAPLVIGFVLVPLAQYFLPIRLPASPEPDLKSRSWQQFSRILPLFSFPHQLLMLYFGAQHWSSPLLNPLGRLGLLLSVGVYGAFFAVNIAHELIHRPHRLDRFLGGLLLSTVSFGTFKIHHLKVHHRFVGTPLDFSTAPRGRSIYEHWFRSLRENFYTTFRNDFAACRTSGTSLWKSELLLWYGFSLLWLGLALWTWGWMGAVFFLLQSLIAIGQLDWINYLQHYGMERKRLPDGHFEAVQRKHSWSQGLVIHDFVLLNLFRHSDHHVNPNRTFQKLRHFEDSPRYPYQHVTMMALSLLPPLFRRVVHPCLDEWKAVDSKTGTTVSTEPIGEGIRKA